MAKKSAAANLGNRPIGPDAVLGRGSHLSPVASLGPGAAPLRPVARETVNDQVYRELRKGLISGLFVPGQVLTIVDLAQSLNTSTMPVRDALSRLISEQALQAMANRSVRVPLIDASRLADLKRVRLLMECDALRQAAPNLTGADLADIRAAIHDHDLAVLRTSAVSLSDELDANWAFHFRIYAASGSTVLLPFIESLWLQLGPIIRTAAHVFDPRSAVSNLRYHIEIIDALEAGDVAEAVAALQRDIGRTFDLLADALAAGVVDTEAGATP